MVLGDRFRREDLILNFDRIRSASTDFIRSNPITTTAIALGVPLTFVGIAAVRRRVTRKRAARKRTTRKRAARKRTTRKRAARRKRSGLRKGVKQKIRFTKKGQPFIITRSGKARFIKKTTATRAKARKGGFT